MQKIDVFSINSSATDYVRTCGTFINLVLYVAPQTRPIELSTYQKRIGRNPVCFITVGSYERYKSRFVTVFVPIFGLNHTSMRQIFSY